MYDDDLDALAAEYVLGTLSAEERGNAEALLGVDAGFADIVRQWERRLGELNVMVEAVEPPPEIWTKIKSEIATVAASDQVSLTPPEPPPAATPEPEATAEAKTETPKTNQGRESALLSALASSLLPSEADGKPAGEPRPEAKPDVAPRPVLPTAGSRIERGADVFYLAHRVRRWRAIALGAAALAAVLALFVAITQIDPDLIPGGAVHVPQLFAQSPSAAPTPGNRLVAVLQQDPTSPAFLLTVDAPSRTLTVRRLAAPAGAGHAYELWLIAPGAAKPRSLGVVGGEEFVQRPVPSGLDVGTLQKATYAISFEPAGGSPSGQPTGPILFKGVLVESVPATPPKT